MFGSVLKELQAGRLVYTHRDAQRVLGDAPADSVLAIRPTGLASSYALTQRPLAVIKLGSLDDKHRDQIDGAVDADLAQFELTQFGRATTPAQNWSLAEFWPSLARSKLPRL